eukprot:scaffold56831_cov64-Phaeocystis_antarctica.AAC.3
MYRCRMWRRAGYHMVRSLRPTVHARQVKFRGRVVSVKVVYFAVSRMPRNCVQRSRQGRALIMAVTRAKFRCNPRRSLVLFGALATKPSVDIRAEDDRGLHFSTMHSGHEHERTACTGCGPAAEETACHGWAATDELPRMGCHGWAATDELPRMGCHGWAATDVVRVRVRVIGLG